MEISRYSFWEPVLKSAGIASVNSIVTICIRLFTIPLLINYLGVERYGLWITISSISAYIMLLDFGVGSALVNRLATYYANSEKKSAESNLSSALIVMSLIALLGIIIGVSILPFINYVNILNISSNIAKHEIVSSIYIAYIMYFIQLPLSLVVLVPYTMQKGSMSEIALLLSNIACATGLIFCYFHGYSLPYFVLFLTGSPVLAAVGLLTFLYRKKLLKITLPPLCEIKADINVMYRIATHFVVIQSIAMLLNTLPVSMLAFYSGITEVAPYGLMTQVIMVLQIPVLVLLKPMWTKIVQLVTHHRYDLISGILVAYLKLAFLYAGLISVFIILFIDPVLINIFMIKIKISLEMRIVFSIWCACGLIAGGGVGTVLLALGQTRVMSIISVIQLIVFFLCALFLLPAKGTVGLVMSIIATYLVAIPALYLTFKTTLSPKLC